MIAFATSNRGKFLDFQLEMNHAGLHDIEQVTLPLTERQEIGIEEIARDKARQAYKILGRPVIVEDSGLCIPALNNFPEALTKPVTARLGLDGFLKILASLDDRRCFFTCALAFVDAHGNTGVIVTDHETGTIQRAPQGELSERARSMIWQIYTPTGHDKTLAAMSPTELQSLFASWRPQNAFAQFARLAAADPARFGLAKAA